MTHGLPESGECGYPPGQGTCNTNLYYITTLLGSWKAFKGIISAEVKSLVSISLLLNQDIRSSGETSSSPNSPINLISLKPLPKAKQEQGPVGLSADGEGRLVFTITAGLVLRQT